MRRSPAGFVLFALIAAPSSSWTTSWRGLLWPGRNAIGQKFYVNVGDSRHPTVVGVIRHLRVRSLVDDLLPQIFMPWQLVQRNPMRSSCGRAEIQQHSRRASGLRLDHWIDGLPSTTCGR